MDILDSEKEVAFRLFREHCQQTSKGYIKNLSRLGRELKDVIMIDNSPIAYSKHQANSLPIVSWYDNMNDSELLNYLPILELASQFNDVRALIPQLVINDQISYEQFNKLLSDSRKNAQIKTLLKNISPKSAQSKHIDFQEKQLFNPNEAKADDSEKKPKIGQKITISNQYKELSKIIGKMNTNIKFATFKIKGKKESQSKVNSETVFNVKNKPRDSSKPPNDNIVIQKDDMQSAVNTMKVISTPKDSSKASQTIYKLTGLKLKTKDSIHGEYTNLIKIGLKAKEEIAREGSEDTKMSATLKKPLLINNLMKEIKCNIHMLKPSNSQKDLKKEMGANCIIPSSINVGFRSSDLQKGSTMRPMTSSMKSMKPVAKLMPHHQKRNSLSIMQNFKQ